MRTMRGSLQRFATLHSETFELLPRSWNTLYVLAQLDWAVFERFLAAGDIYPGLTLREARELLARSEGRQAPVNPPDRSTRFGNRGPVARSEEAQRETQRMCARHPLGFALRLAAFAE